MFNRAITVALVDIREGDQIGRLLFSYLCDDIVAGRYLEFFELLVDHKLEHHPRLVDVYVLLDPIIKNNSTIYDPYKRYVIRQI